MCKKGNQAIFKGCYEAMVILNGGKPVSNHLAQQMLKERGVCFEPQHILDKPGRPFPLLRIPA